ncbi:flagellar biosynthetic protein FliO [bacterium]|nr:flagellar biosynthetic protein FliO [bacterium]
MEFNYLTNFAVYATAMVGVFMIAVFVFKKCMQPSKVSKGKNLSVEETITLAPGKILYIVRAGGEKFLIASDRERTNLISKLNEQPIRQNKFMNLQDYSVSEMPTTGTDVPVMKELLKKIGG